MPGGFHARILRVDLSSHPAPAAPVGRAREIPAQWYRSFLGGSGLAARLLFDELRPVGVLDFHTAHYILMPSRKSNKKLVAAIHEDIKNRLRDRFLCQRPYNGDYQQVNMDNISDEQDAPYVICYAADRGAKAAILVEMSGNRDDMHGMVMVTDSVCEICLATATQCLKYVTAAKRRRSAAKKATSRKR